jgi:hypothetical protein
MQFVALTTLNEKLTEQLRDKEAEIKEIHRHRKLLAEIDSSKKFERELAKQKLEKERLSNILARE